MMQLNIKNKLLIAFIGVSIIPLMFVSWLSLGFAERTILDLYVKQADTIAFSSATNLSTYINRIIGKFASLETNTVLINNLAILQKYSGNQSSKEYQLAKSKIDALLQALQRTENVSDVFLANQQGIIYCNADNAYSLAYLGKPLSSIGAGPIPSKISDVNISSIFKDSVGNKAYNMLVSLPLIDSKYHQYGTIAIELPIIDVFYKSFISNRNDNAKTMEVILGKTTKEGMLAASPLQHYDFTVLKKLIAQKPLIEIDHRGYAIETDYLGHQAIFVWQYIPELGLNVIVKTNKNEVLYPVKRFREFFYLTTVIGTLLSALLAIYLANLMTRPLLNLASNVAASGRDELVTDIMPQLLLRKDEIGNLANAFYDKGKKLNEYFTELHVVQEKLEKKARELEKTNQDLQSLQKKLLTTARQAGMAEVATSILHNVGNILNSAKVSTQLINENMRKPDFNNLVNIAGMIKDHLNDLPSYFSEDPKGKLIPGYLIALVNALETSNKTMFNKVTDLAENIKHIENIVAMQQSLSGVYGVAEKVLLSETINTAIQMCRGGLDKHNIQLQTEVDNSLFVIIDQSKLLQILVNLIQNAIDAMGTANEVISEKHIDVKMQKKQDTVEIITSDNGIGIKQENLIKIFSLGFTTKPKGHGFGLHSSALLAKELGGQLTVTSAGLGKGTSFTLTLPLNMNQVVQLESDHVSTP